MREPLGFASNAISALVWGIILGFAAGRVGELTPLLALPSAMLIFNASAAIGCINRGKQNDQFDTTVRTMRAGRGALHWMDAGGLKPASEIQQPSAFDQPTAGDREAVEPANVTRGS